jgi:phosphatidylserine decarboxylase
MYAGGSTILLLFEPGVMQWDDDLIDNSNGALETLVSTPYSYHIARKQPLIRLPDSRRYVSRP